MIEKIYFLILFLIFLPIFVHRMTHSILIKGIISALLGILMLSGCTNHETEKPLDLPVDLFREGDIAFRKGTGLTSRVVLSADKEGTYSHTGILKQLDGKWYVVHAVPDEPDYEGDVDRVKLDPVERFFSSNRASNGAVMRMEVDPEKACHAAQRAFDLYRAHILFDHEYDLNDTAKMYCTELVNHVYLKEGIDLSEGRITYVNFPGFTGNYLMPNDITCNKKLHLIYTF